MERCYNRMRHENCLFPRATRQTLQGNSAKRRHPGSIVVPSPMSRLNSVFNSTFTRAVTRLSQAGNSSDQSQLELACKAACAASATTLCVEKTMVMFNIHTVIPDLDTKGTLNILPRVPCSGALYPPDQLPVSIQCLLPAEVDRLVDLLRCPTFRCFNVLLSSEEGAPSKMHPNDHCRHEAAIKIQRVCRGYLGRRSAPVLSGLSLSIRLARRS